MKKNRSLKKDIDIDADTTQLQFLERKAALVDFLKCQRPRREPNRVRVITKLDKIMHRSCYRKPVNYYFTSGRKIVCPRMVETEASPYFIDARILAKEKIHLDRIEKLPNHLKPSVREKAVIGLNDRLYIPQNDPNYPPPKTITKFAPDYYKMIVGSPIEQSYFNKQGYISRLKKTFYNRLRHAVQEEISLAEEEKSLRELCYLIYIRNEHVKMIDLFNQFLKDNMEELIAVTDATVKMAKLVEIKAIEIKIIHGALENIKDSLYHMDEILCYRRLCKTTLDELSPEYWKMEYNKEKEKLQPIADKAADYVLQMFSYFKLEIPFPDDNLEKLVLRLSNTIRTLGPPAIYFKSPDDLYISLKKLEHSTVIAIETLNNSFHRRADVVEKDKEILRAERKSLNVLRSDIESIKNEFSKRLSPIITIEEETGVILSYWRAVATNPDLLQAFVHIKCLHEQFVGDEEPTNDIVKMLSSLTDKIVETQMKVNSLPSDEVSKIYNKIRSRDETKKHGALTARKLKTEADRMLKKMKKHFENRFPYPGIPRHFRVLESSKQKEVVEAPRPITPPNKQMMKNILKIFQPTVSQEAYLNLLDSVKELNKVENKLKIVKYPHSYPPLIIPSKFVSPKTSEHSFTMEVTEFPEDPSESDSYIERMRAIAEKGSEPDIPDC